MPNLRPNQTISQPATQAACAKDYQAGAPARATAAKQQTVAKAKRK